jgi:hypothetical protein
MGTEQPTSCQAANQSGKPCSAAHWRDGWCRWHHPDLTEQRKAWSAKGGQQRSNRARAKKQLPADLLTTEELHSWLGIVFKKVITGTLDPPIATAAANVARTMVELTKTTLLEDRMADLERRLGGKAS